MSARDLTAERLRELLDYSQETGRFTWRTARNGVLVGSTAGWASAKGYTNISVDGHTHQAHRLAWLHSEGQWPQGQIDHINGEKADNRIANLRDVSPRLNAENRLRAMPTSKSGVMGVRRGRTQGKWEAWIAIQGRRTYIGVFTSSEEAHTAYVEAKRVHHVGCTL